MHHTAKKEGAAKNEPESVEDFLEEGAADEESGDRWHGSDLAKALRFYQKAYSNYKLAVGLGKPEQRDFLQLAHYNALRLLFHVYLQYQREDAVQISDLKNVAEVVDAGVDSVVQEIAQIIQAHESALEFSGPDAPIDLLFNTAMVYMDAVEDAESASEAYGFVDRATALLREVLQRQIAEIQENNGEPRKDAETDSSDPPVTASDLLETVISIFNLAQTLYEAVGSSNNDIQTASSLIGPFVTHADQVAAELLNGSLHIYDYQKQEYLVSKAYCSASSFTNLEDITRVWDDQQLPESPERYMLAADCIDNFMQRSGLSSGPTVNPEIYWAALTKMTQYFKVAQEALSGRLQAIKGLGFGNQQLGVGAIISQIAKVNIARADIDLQRSQLPLEQATKNQTLLMNNAKAFLKNATTFAKQAGGIREKAVEKAQREKRRVEAVCRLCVLEGKTDELELDSIIGVGRWQTEFEVFRDLWYFPIQ